jgi:3',5'-cyclic AMP phosphodiesterase CpdA
MTRALQISDPHFGTEQPEVVTALQVLIADLQPEVVLLSGDVTQRARRAQFEAARRFMQQLPCPVMAVPGNHDIPLFNLLARFTNPYGNYRRVFGNDLEPEYESDGLLVLGVNSTRASRHKDGEVSVDQVARIAERLRRARPEQLRVVMQHHPVKAVAETDVSNLLIGREQAVPAWVDAGMDLLIGGHIHLPYVWPIQGEAGEASRRAWTAQAGTATSDRLRGDIPNSVNLITHRVTDGRHCCAVERWDYSRQGGSFCQVLVTDMELDRD